MFVAGFLIFSLVALFAIGAFVVALFHKKSRKNIGRGLAAGSAGCLVVIAVIGVGVCVFVTLLALAVLFTDQDGSTYDFDPVEAILYCVPIGGLLALIVRLAWDWRKYLKILRLAWEKKTRPSPTVSHTPPSAKTTKKKARSSPTVPHTPPPVKKAKKIVTPTVTQTPPAPSPTPKPISGSDCPNCGSPWDGDSCSICGHSLRQTLSLAKEDGQAIAMGLLKLDLNQAWAKRKLGEDGQFWDKNLQFSLEPRNQNWVVIPNPSATNETMVDGVAIITEVILTDGMILSVGKQAKGIQKTPLIVRLG